MGSKITNYKNQARTLVLRRETEARAFAQDCLAEHQAILLGWNLTDAVRNNKDLADLLGAAGSADYECRALVRGAHYDNEWPELRRRLKVAGLLFNHAAMLCTFCGWLREERDTWECLQEEKLEPAITA